MINYYQLTIAIVASVSAIISTAVIYFDLVRIPLINTVNFIFHEAGHFIFYIFGETTMFIMGSGVELLIPFGITIYFLRNKQSISASISSMWLATAVASVSVYIADAPLQQLELWGGGLHDWAYLLGKYSLLDITEEIVLIFKIIWLVIIIFINYACYKQLLRRSSKNRWRFA